MEPIVRQALLGHYENAGGAEYVFTNPDTGTRYNDIKKSFSAACREAGITHFTFHDLRHTFGTRLADAGVDVVKSGAIVVLSEYRQRHRQNRGHKMVTNEKRQVLQPAASH